jgi:hypothetical protein
MKTWLFLPMHVLALLLLAAGFLRAEGDCPSCEGPPRWQGPGPNYPVIQAMVDKHQWEHPDPYGRDPQIYSPNEEPCRPRQPVCDFFRKCGCGCWSHHNCPGCGSLESETRFIFGSCRAFFGEPCMRGPRDLPVPIGMYGYGPVREGCGCP